MDRGAWKAAVYGVQGVGRDVATEHHDCVIYS